jgi:hypothetical protein
LEFPASDIDEMVNRLRRHASGDLPAPRGIDWLTVEIPDR